MPKEIKTRTVIKDIKLLDKAASGTAHVKDAFIRSKQSAENTQDPQHHSANEYASDNMTGARNVAEGAANRLKNPHKKAADNVNKAKEHFKEAKRQLPKQRKEAAEQAKKAADSAKNTADTLKGKAEQAQKTAEQAKKAVTDAKRTYQQTRQVGRQTVQIAKQTVKTGRQAEKTIKTSAKAAKATGKGTVKTVQKSVKTAERSAKATVKTAQQTAKATQKSAQAAAKAAKLAAQASKAAAKAATAAAKAATKAVIAMVKAAIAAIKGLVAIIAAGGWIAVLIIIIICLIALILGSVFGIFFSGSTDGLEGRTMQSVMAELNNELLAQSQEIQSRETYDRLNVEAFSIRWPEVLAVYAVKVNSDPDNPDEVVTLTDEKVDVLRSVFNDMVSLSYSLETEEVEQTTTDASGHETTETVTATTLVITLSHKSADEMAAQYAFSQSQKDQMHELLDPQYDDLWQDIAA